MTVVDAAHPGRATDAGAGILSPATSTETDAGSVAVPAPVRRALPGVAGAPARRRGRHRRRGLRRLRHPLHRPAAPRGRAGSPRSPSMVVRRSPGDVSEIPPRRPGRSSRRSGPSTASCTRRARRALTAGAWRPRCARPPPHAGWSSSTGAVHGVVAAEPGGAPRRVSQRRRAPQRRLRRPGRRRWSVDGGGGGVARPATAGRTHEGADRASRRRGGDGRLAHRAAAAHPLSRALARRSGGLWWHVRDRAPGTRSPSRPPGCTSCCASACSSRRACRGAAYLETRVGLRPTSADDRALVGRVPGWGNVFVATGHGANGLLQGPYSARALAHAITGLRSLVDEAPLPSAFDPARFA